MDFARLMQALVPEVGAAGIARMRAAAALGISRRMALAARILGESLGEPGMARMAAQASDTARGWACFMVGAAPGLSLAQRLARIRPLADDAHFGVREWAWLAARPALAADLDAAIAQLQAWTALPSERLRRFAKRCGRAASGARTSPRSRRIRGRRCRCWSRCAPIRRSMCRIRWRTG
ncbi:hypothetical protein WJ978_25020 [Achromobacter xylosoxidans]